MTDDADIREKARLLIEQHGQEAVNHAGLSAETLLAAGQFYIDQWTIWRRIEKAVGELLEDSEGAVTADAKKPSLAAPEQ